MQDHELTIDKALEQYLNTDGKRNLSSVINPPV
jgi:hypothetical protein